MDTRFALVDIETTGLDLARDLILEVGMRLYDQNGAVISEIEVPIWSPVHAMRMNHLKNSSDRNDKFVYDMHAKSGLWDHCILFGNSHDLAQEKLAFWLTAYSFDSTDPMMGSTVSFDRGFLKQDMPRVESAFHYRNIDISTLKELCKRLNPGLYSHLAEETSKLEAHRALSDIGDTWSEFLFYRDNFLYI